MCNTVWVQFHVYPVKYLCVQYNLLLPLGGTGSEHKSKYTHRKIQAQIELESSGRI